MRISRTSLAIGVAALALVAAGIPALGQDKPESLLPPGFDQPVPAASQAADQPAPPPASAPVNAAVPDAAPTPKPSVSASATAVAVDPALLARYELPDYARRSLARVGLAGAESLPANAFGRADGRFLETVMRRTQAPIASRWLSIALRRTLMSAVDTPPRVDGADFAAERAWLLLRMGEGFGARAVVQGVDPDRASPKLMQVAMQASLATSDPGGMCPFIDTAPKVLREPGWTVARAMCLALSGSPGEAGSAIDSAKRRGLGDPIDVLLAEKIVGAGSQGRRAVTIEWNGVERLTAWRFGLATASGVEIPAELMAAAGPQVRSWRAQSAMIEPAQRVGDAEFAAAQGVLSNAALVGLYGELEAIDDSTAEAGVARDLRTAYAAGTAAERLVALKGLWAEAKSEPARYGRYILTAQASARMRAEDAGEDSDRLIASMLSAGLDHAAARWQNAVSSSSDAWAMIALSDPATRSFSYGDVNSYGGGELKTQMLFAGLAGLGRLTPDDIARGADSLEVDISGRDSWSRAIDAAARADQPGTVVLLCAAGMQTGDWRGVPPASLYRMVAALRATGLEGYARMIAAEAIARL